LAATVLALIALILQSIRSIPGSDGKLIVRQLFREDSQEIKGTRESRVLDSEAENSGVTLRDESLLMRLDPASGWYNDEVRCWPSLGGIIIAAKAQPVELAFLAADRFYPTSRSPNAGEEGEFSRSRRWWGGNWWMSYHNFELATVFKAYQLWPDEIDVSYLGRPEDGSGLWLLRYGSYAAQRRDIEREVGMIYNAFTMDERCLGIRLSGGTFFENPDNSE
jgi:hypothetical protein